jgi:hypothetical protein
VVVLFIVVFHSRGCHSRRTVVEVSVALYEIAVNATIAFVVFVAAVVVIAVGCFYSSYLLDVDRCEWKNGVSMLRKVTGIYTQSDIDVPFSLVGFLSI